MEIVRQPGLKSLFLMQIRIPDTHAHLDDPRFDADRDAVIKRALDAGVGPIITIGTDLESSRRAIALAEQYPDVYAVVGWHPSEATAAPRHFREALAWLVKHPRVVAVGETGLDYHRLPSKGGAGLHAEHDYVSSQKALFRIHLEVAVEAGLNVVVHQRDAFEDAMAMLDEFMGRVLPVFHCFGGDSIQAGQITARGWLVSFTGVVTFKNAVALREVVRKIPPGSFMLETDCPYLAPEPYRGKRCEPYHVLETARRVAELRGLTLSALADEIMAVTRSFFQA